MKKLIFAGIVLLGLALLAADVPYGPTVVSKTEFITRSSSIGATTLYTPTVEGDYQVQFYGLARSCGAGNSSMNGTLNWTDAEATEQYLDMDAGPGGTGSVVGIGFTTLHSAASSPIQYSATYSAGSSNCAYDLYLTVIKE